MEEMIGKVVRSMLANGGRDGYAEEGDMWRGIPVDIVNILQAPGKPQGKEAPAHSQGSQTHAQVPQPQANSQALPSHPYDFVAGETSYLISIDMPGVKKADIDITVTDSTITVSTKRSYTPWGNQQFYMKTRNMGESRTHITPLPLMASTHNITTSYEDGVLYIRIPKKESAGSAPRKIKVM